MELMGAYAAANHELIHRHVTRALGAGVRLDIENHHNFAWRERHVLADGSERDVIVHRKGATPAGMGVLGIIPGSMASPGYVVRGKGDTASLRSASHGAGRRMSRTRAKQEYTWADAKRVLEARGVTLLSAGLDEVPMAYKDIDTVMAAQRSLVDTVARFDPRLVKMAPAGETPED
jgi:tRNA-splicing ligase RtcB